MAVFVLEFLIILLSGSGLVFSVLDGIESAENPSDNQIFLYLFVVYIIHGQKRLRGLRPTPEGPKIRHPLRDGPKNCNRKNINCNNTTLFDPTPRGDLAYPRMSERAQYGALSCIWEKEDHLLYCKAC